MISRTQRDHLKSVIDRFAQHPQSFSGDCFRCAKPKYGMPMTTLSANVQLGKVLDLTDALVLQSLGVTLTDIRDAPWNNPAGETLTQVIGRLAYEAGFEALLAPSGSGDDNVNLFPANLQTISVLKIINEQDLPPPT